MSSFSSSLKRINWFAPLLALLPLSLFLVITWGSALALLPLCFMVLSLGYIGYNIYLVSQNRPATLALSSESHHRPSPSVNKPLSFRPSLARPPENLSFEQRIAAYTRVEGKKDYRHDGLSDPAERMAIYKDTYNRTRAFPVHFVPNFTSTQYFDAGDGLKKQQQYRDPGDKLKKYRIEKVFIPSPKQQSPEQEFERKISVCNMDSFEVAQELMKSGAKGRDIMVLNLANAFRAGGGVVEGAPAQEECLYRSSNYASLVQLEAERWFEQPLDQDGNPLPWTHQSTMRYKYPLIGKSSFYTPGVQILRQTLSAEPHPAAGKYASQQAGTAKVPYALIPDALRPETISCLAVAGYDLRDPKNRNARNPSSTDHLLKEPFGRSEGKYPESIFTHGVDNRTKLERLSYSCSRSSPTINWIIREFKDETKEKIRHIFDVAKANQHSILILGAMSCGAFNWKGHEKEVTTAVVEAYQEVLAESAYERCFERIIFPILVNNPLGEQNFKIFREGFSADYSAEENFRRKP